MTSVLIVDPMPAYRRGLRAVLTEAGFAVEEAINLDDWSGSHDADALVVTVQSPSFLDTVREIISSGATIPVIALVDGRDSEQVADALRAGVNGVVERGAPPELVADALRVALGHHAVIPKWAAGAFAARIPTRPPSDQWVSEDEVHWLRLLAHGVTVADLADEVGYSEREMFRNLHDLYTRIRVGNRTGALLWAERHGLFDRHRPDEDSQTG